MPFGITADPSAEIFCLSKVGLILDECPADSSLLHLNQHDSHLLERAPGEEVHLDQVRDLDHLPLHLHLPPHLHPHPRPRPRQIQIQIQPLAGLLVVEGSLTLLLPAPHRQPLFPHQC